MSKTEVAELIASQDFKPFWDEVDKIRRAEMEQLFKTEDAAFLKGLKVLDRIVQIPRVMRSAVAQANAR